jgi:tetratricopeptide (TPR) repeat protein
MNLKIFFTACFAIATCSLFAQENTNPDGKYGNDELECKKNLSLYVTFYQQKNYTDAMIGWRYVYNECPKSSKNIFLHGINMFNYFIENEKDPVKKEAYIDTLMMIYDKRVEITGDEGKVIGRKAIDLYKYRNEKVLEEAFGYLKKSLELSQNSTESIVLFYLVQTAVKMQASGKINCDEVVGYYSQAVDIHDMQIKEAEGDSAKKENLYVGKANIDNLFINCPCASCQAIIPIFSKKFTEDPNNIDLLKNIVKILGKQGCTDDDLFAKAAENLIKVDTTGNLIDPVSYASFLKKKGEYSKAAKFYLKALDQKEDTKERADIYYNLADIYGNDLGQKAQGRTYAYEALKLRPNWGLPYLLIGILYANSSNNCGESNFQKKAVFWVAVDKFAKARSVDPECASEANNLISKYTIHFPIREDAFFEGITEGQSYTVGCWINESTTTRFNQ